MKSGEITESSNVQASRSYWADGREFPGMRKLGEGTGQGRRGVRVKLKIQL